jgi:branched-chain amino acid transport system ATP-binding protein
VPPLLEVSGLTKVFGGVKAVDGVTFVVAEGAVSALIGPNGAGKTTLFNLITGLAKASTGAVVVGGRDVTGLSPHRLAALGVRRSFQNLRLCRGMTALENVMVGAHLRLRGGMLAGMTRLPGLVRADRACADEARALIAFVGLERYAATDVAQMPFGAQKLLEIARALAGQPRLLLLDEPAAGLNQSERVALQDLIARVAMNGRTVLLVEHDMRLVMSLANHVVVLANGRKLAEGTPAEVRRNPAVIAAYLGTSTAEAVLA